MAEPLRWSLRNSNFHLAVNAKDNARNDAISHVMHLTAIFLPLAMRYICNFARSIAPGAMYVSNALPRVPSERYMHYTADALHQFVHRWHVSFLFAASSTHRRPGKQETLCSPSVGGDATGLFSITSRLSH